MWGDPVFDTQFLGMLALELFDLWNPADEIRNCNCKLCFIVLCNTTIFHILNPKESIDTFVNRVWNHLETRIVAKGWRRLEHLLNVPKSTF